MDDMPKLKPLSRCNAALLILGCVVLADAVTIWVLDRNLRNGVYSPNADAILFLIVLTVMNSIYLLLAGLVGALLPRTYLALRIVSRLLLLLASAFSAALAVYWWIPHHSLAGAAFLPAVVACLWAQWMPPSMRLPANTEDDR